MGGTNLDSTVRESLLDKVSRCKYNKGERHGSI